MAHPDLEVLLNALLPFAEDMLAKHGEFYPYGATLGTDGEVSQIAGHTGDDRPLSQPLIELMMQGCRQQAAAGAIKAAGICCDIRTIPPGQKDKTDAICVSLEHQSGEAVDVILPYKKGWFGKMTYGDLFAVKRQRTIFPS